MPMTMPTARPERRAVDGIILLDKPAGLSSNAALQRVKRIFHADRAGHTGSLDPLATGLLPICLGQATRLAAYLLDADKSYAARVQLGVATDTGDAEGAVVARAPVRVSREALVALIPRFLGEIEQVPPMYSALKREGRPLYALAREGIEVERAPRRITIHELRLTRFADAQFDFEVRCSKGTYIRTLAEDWARAASEEAHLAALRRTAVAGFAAASMIGLEALADAATDPRRLSDLLLPPLAALAHWPRLSVQRADEQRLRQGGGIAIDPAYPTGAICVVDADGQLIWIAEHDGKGLLAPKRWLGRDRGGDAALEL